MFSNPVYKTIKNGFCVSVCPLWSLPALRPLYLHFHCRCIVFLSCLSTFYVMLLLLKDAFFADLKEEYEDKRTEHYEVLHEQAYMQPYLPFMRILWGSRMNNYMKPFLPFMWTLWGCRISNLICSLIEHYEVPHEQLHACDVSSCINNYMRVIYKPLYLPYTGVVHMGSCMNKLILIARLYEHRTWRVLWIPLQCVL